MKHYLAKGVNLGESGVAGIGKGGRNLVISQQFKETKIF